MDSCPAVKGGKWTVGFVKQNPCYDGKERRRHMPGSTGAPTGILKKSHE